MDVKLPMPATGGQKETRAGNPKISREIGSSRRRKGGRFRCRPITRIHYHKKKTERGVKTRRDLMKKVRRVTKKSTPSLQNTEKLRKEDVIME